MPKIPHFTNCKRQYTMHERSGQNQVYIRNIFVKRFSFEKYREITWFSHAMPYKPIHIRRLHLKMHNILRTSDGLLRLIFFLESIIPKTSEMKPTESDGSRVSISPCSQHARTKLTFSSRPTWG